MSCSRYAKHFLSVAPCDDLLSLQKKKQIKKKTLSLLSPPLSIGSPHSLPLASKVMIVFRVKWNKDKATASSFEAEAPGHLDSMGIKHTGLGISLGPCTLD